MIDIATVMYQVVIVDSKKNEHNITAYIKNLGWQENKNEISARISFDVKNDKTSKGYLSSLIKPGCLIYLFAKHGAKKYEEIVRGYVETWENGNQNSSHDLKCMCYDDLYKLQKSQDNFYFRSGTGTKARITQVLKKVKIMLGSYFGPNKKHGKKKYQSKSLSDILLDILDDAYKKGGKKCVIRQNKGKLTVIPRGSNDDIYVFEKDNTKVVTNSRSTANLVTKVKVIGTTKKEKNAVIATVNGLTKYGIRQKIYTRGSDESLKQAKKAAQEIINESGDIEKEITVQSPDVPYLHKGDMIYMDVGSVTGYYYVTGIQHDASTLSMTMNIEPAEKNAISKNKKTTSSSPKVGDVVDFKGDKHYVSSTGTKYFSAKAGKAKITKINSSGKHPYHLIHTSSQSNVYGWVDEGTFS